MMRKLGVGTLCGLVAALAACSPSAGETDVGTAGTAGVTTAGGGGSATAGSAGTSTGGAAVGGAGGSASAGAAGSAPRTHYGQVLVQYLYSTGARQTLSATFTDAAPASSRTCTRQGVGACSVSLCSPATDAAPSARPPTAGSITFASPDVPGGATIMPDATGVYVAAALQFEPGLTGGERGSVTATGGEIPAFQTDLDVPLVLLLSQPVPPTDGGSMTAPRTQPLSLTWTRGVPDVTLRIVAGSQQRVDGAPGTTSIGCVFDSVDGSGSIDAALLAQVPAGTQLNLFTTRTKPVQAGDYDISVGYVTSAATPEKKAFPNIELE